MTVIVDYGVGNLFSLESALKQLGFPSLVSGDPQIIRAADRVLLPGVGAFRDARERLRINGLDELLCREADAGKPLMGICLGMQLFFERSYEYGITEGLGLIPGEVREIADVIPEGYKVPHIGWNALDFVDKMPDGSVFKYIADRA